MFDTEWHCAMLGMLSQVAMDDSSVDVSEVHELVSWDPPVTWFKMLLLVFTLLSVPLMRLSGSSLMRHAITGHQRGDQRGHQWHNQWQSNAIWLVPVDAVLAPPLVEDLAISRVDDPAANEEAAPCDHDDQMKAPPESKSVNKRGGKNDGVLLLCPAWLAWRPRHRRRVAKERGA
jgi:hypothetical protein